jgi:hypothetical protein
LQLCGGAFQLGDSFGKSEVRDNLCLKDDDARAQR